MHFVEGWWRSRSQGASLKSGHLLENLLLYSHALKIVLKNGQGEKTKEGSLGLKDNFPPRHCQTWSSGSFQHGSSSQTGD